MVWLYILVFSKTSTATVFIASSASKFRDFSTFQQTISNLQVFPSAFTKQLAYLVSVTECLIVMVFLSGIPSFLSLGFWLSIFMLSIFSITLWIIIRRGLQISCGCFGSFENIVSRSDIWRNIGFIFIATAGLLSLTMLSTQQIQIGMLESGLIGIMSIVLTILALW